MAEQVPDLIGSLGGGGQLGLSVGRRLGERKQEVLGRQQQELLGGLRRASLGLGGQNQAERLRAQTELGAISGAQLKDIRGIIGSLDAPRLESLKEDNKLMTNASATIAALPIGQQRQALIQLGDQFEAQGHPLLARGARETAAIEDDNELSNRLLFNQNLGRESEKIFAENERKAIRLAEQSKSDIDKDLKKSKNQFDQIDKLRNRVTTVSKEFSKVRDANNRIDAIFDTNKAAAEGLKFANAAKNNPNAVDIAQSTEAFGDMALIFNFMKMLDPGSTVREGEFASAQNTSGVDEKIVNLYNQALKGTRLSDSQRAGLRAQATGLFNKAKSQNDKDLSRFRKSADAFNLPHDQIFDADENGVVNEPAPAAGQTLTSKSGIKFTVK